MINTPYSILSPKTKRKKKHRYTTYQWKFHSKFCALIEEAMSHTSFVFWPKERAEILKLLRCHNVIFTLALFALQDLAVTNHTVITFRMLQQICTHASQRPIFPEVLE